MIVKYCIPVMVFLVLIALALVHFHYPMRLNFSIMLAAILGVVVLGLTMQFILLQRMQISLLNLKYAFLLSRADRLTLYYLGELSKQGMQVEGIVETIEPEPEPEPQLMPLAASVPKSLSDRLRDANAFVVRRRGIRALDTGDMIDNFLHVHYRPNPEEPSIDLIEMLAQDNASGAHMMMAFGRMMVLLHQYALKKRQFFTAMPCAVLINRQLLGVTKQMDRIWMPLTKKIIFSLSAEEFMTASKLGKERLYDLHMTGLRYALNWHDRFFSADTQDLFDAGVRYILIDFESLVSLQQDGASTQAFQRLSTKMQDTHIVWIVRGVNDMTPPQTLIDRGIMLSLDSYIEE